MAAHIAPERPRVVDPAESYRTELPRPLTASERLSLARIAGWIDGNRHCAGCACVTCHGKDGRPGMRHQARQAVRRGCPYPEIDGVGDVRWCGACCVCQIEAAILGGRL